jgi:uridine kinase
VTATRRTPPSGHAGRIASLAVRAEPRCGATVVVGIDGPSGSGKSTLAAGVEAELGCPVVHMDDLFPGWDGLARAAELVTDQVFRPLASGSAAEYRKWDWDASEWGDRVTLPWTALLIVEGCAATVRPAGDFVAVRIWVEAALEVRMARGMERDGEAYRPHWERWAAQERALFAGDGTRGRADLIVRT